MSNKIALQEYLKPLKPLLDDPLISEIAINNPQEVYIEKQGEMQCQSFPQLTYYHLEGLTNLIAHFSKQRLNQQFPTLAANLPSGQRIQIVIPPACESQKIIIAIRKKSIQALLLDDYQQQQAFTTTQPAIHFNQICPKMNSQTEQHLQSLFQDRQYAIFLKYAVRYKKNILISGGTGTGKTTLLNACLQEIPLYERVITLEDVREIEIPHQNKVHLIASKNQQGITNITMTDLVQVCLRLRPDRIIMGEMRGEEAADFCNATATGHDGSIASIHASNPKLAFLRLVHMMKLKPGMNLTRNEILEDLTTLIDIVVQVQREKTNNNYRRFISEIYYAHELPI